MHTRYNNLPRYLSRRRESRQRMTKAERILWKKLRAKRMGLKFRRHHSYGHYIMDFYCKQVRVCIELDGMHHMYDPKQKAHDLRRDAFLHEHGILVLRFQNKEVYTNVAYVLDRIWSVCQERIQIDRSY